jgi:hypothetical protein
LIALQIRVEGADFRNGVMVLVDGHSVTLRIVASDETGRVRAGPGQAWNRGFLTDTDGSFDLEALCSGDYLAFAAEDAGIEYQNPVATRSYLAHAKPIHVEAHGIYSQDLPVTPKLPDN